MRAVSTVSLTHEMAAFDNFSAARCWLFALEGWACLPPVSLAAVAYGGVDGERLADRLAIAEMVAPADAGAE